MGLILNLTGLNSLIKIAQNKDRTPRMQLIRSRRFFFVFEDEISIKKSIDKMVDH